MRNFNLHNQIHTQIITLTTNISGDIISNNQLSSNPFRDCKNIYDIDKIKTHKNILISNFDKRKIIINVRQAWCIFKRCKSAVSPVDGNNESRQGCSP